MTVCYSFNSLISFSVSVVNFMITSIVTPFIEAF